MHQLISPPNENNSKILGLFNKLDNNNNGSGQVFNPFQTLRPYAYNSEIEKNIEINNRSEQVNYRS